MQDGVNAADGLRAPEAPPLDGPKGIGGWLILPILGLIGTVLLTGYNLLATLGQLGGEQLTILRQSFPAVLGMVIVSMIAGVLLVIYAIYCLKLIFAEDARAPSAVILYFVALVAVSMFETFAAYYMASQFGQPSVADGAGMEFLRSLVGAAIWIPYFINSKRVKNTFVKRP